MNVQMRLQVRQAQSLALTPQLLQSIRLLQYGHLDLRAYLQREAERNPLIEVRDRGAKTPFAGTRPSRIAGPGGRAGPDVEGLAGDPAPSLPMHALAEIRDILAEEDELRIAEALLAELDEAGYLRADITACGHALGVEPGRIEAVLERLRAEAEPAGLFAADLADCLRIQLRRRKRLDPVIETVLSHLDLLARADFPALRRLTGEDEAGLLDILSELRGLDPRPGRLFEPAPGLGLEPDVLVLPARDGWRVSLNSRVLPRVLVDEEYGHAVGQACRTDAEREFLGECRASANWLTRALDQRARTILKVASEIMRRQEGFLCHGLPGLKPMTLAMVGEAVSLHESTVSRVTANKMIQTPRGTFEMRFFFTAAIASSTGGEAHSAAGVKERIRRMVAAERPGRVLSDDDIAAALKADGVELARRTVAKYREALGIASSVQRRREMNARRLAS